MPHLSGVPLATCKCNLLLQINVNASPEIHAGKLCWGALYDPKTGLQKQWPQQWTEFGVPCGCMQVAVNRLYEAFWPSCQARPNSPAPTLHPQSALFSAPFLWCIGQSNTLREFVCGHDSCLLTKRGSKQHRHRPKWTKVSNISSVQHQTWVVPNSPF